MSSRTGTVNIYTGAKGQLDPILGVTDADFTQAERLWGARASFTLTDSSGIVHEFDGADVKILNINFTR